ncbi:MAG TPA: discoidin domain-containing protein [Kofleriaceae bacterium]|nr:discoidin domain-containing protein [Kofleriaceae bacterium]
MNTRSVIPGLLSALYAFTTIAACAALDDAGAPADPDELGTAVSELQYDDPSIEQSDGPIQLWTGPFSAYTDNRTIGHLCRAGRVQDHLQLWSDYPTISNASESGAFLNGETDCTARISMTVGAGHWDNFYWRIYSRPRNLALNMPASQSSTLGGAGAWRAVDGNKDGNWYAGSVTHTNSETGAWWQVDLGTPTNIGAVVVYNRTDCCSERLSNFDVLAFDGTSWQPIGGITGPAPTRNEFRTNVNARIIRVQLRGTDYLSLAEVQVFPPL